MKKVLSFLFGLFAVVFGFYAIIKLVSNFEIILGLISLSFGILAIIWTLRAKYSLSPKSTLRLYTNNFLGCLIAILMFSVWRILGKFFLFKEFLYVEYFFIIIAYLSFVSAAYYILYIGKEFGFEKEAKRIKKILKKKM